MKRASSELSKCLSPEEIALLAAVYGPGQRLYIPSFANCEGLEAILGLVATSRLIHAFSGNYIYLPGLPAPTGREGEPSLEQVRRLSQMAMSAPQIARKYGCSVRTIYGKMRKVRHMEEGGRWPRNAPQTGRKSVNLKNARARQRRDKPQQEPVSLRRSAPERQTNDDA